MSFQSESIWIEPVTGSKSVSNLLWASVLLFGALGFLLIGLSSYFGKDLSTLLPSQGIVFTPQGLVMCFYGTGGLFLSSYLWCAIFWGVGSGYNEFDRKSGTISVFRWGFPGKNRKVRVRCFIQDIQSVELEMNKSLSSCYHIVFQFKNQQQLPLIQVGRSSSLIQIEERAAQLGQFLRIPIKGL